MDMMMSQKEALRAQVMLDSVRQIKRIVRRYRTEGLPGLMSKQRGIPSNRRLNEMTRRLSIELIGTHYRDFGPTLASEKLFERHDITLSVECTRQLMIESGFWKPRKGVRVCVHPSAAAVRVWAS